MLEELEVEENIGFALGAGDHSNESAIKKFWRNYWKWRKNLTRRFSMKLFYPNRPVLTLIIGICIIGLAFIGILPLWLAIFLGVNVMIDDILITPIMQVISDIRNLRQKRKVTKSIIHLVAMGVGFLLGALLGYFLFMSMPALVMVMPLVRAGIETSLTLFALAGTGAMLISRLTKISPLIIMLFVGLMILALPIPMVFPIAVDIVVASCLIGGFFAAIASKFVVKVVYKKIYGDSNADGLNFAHSKNQISVDQERADVFDVKVEVAQKFRVALIAVMNTIKRNKVFPYYTKVTGSRKLHMAAYKDIFHAFLRANKDDATSMDDVKALINLDEQTDDSLMYYYDKPRLIKNDVYGKKRPVSGFFAHVGAASNTFSKSRKGFEFKQKMHHFHAGYVKAKMYNTDKESMQVCDDYQDAARAFYEGAFGSQRV